MEGYYIDNDGVVRSKNWANEDATAWTANRAERAMRRSERFWGFVGSLMAAGAIYGVIWLLG
jgi:hypothetical protein